MLLCLAVLLCQFPSTALARPSDAKGATTLNAYGAKQSKKGPKKPTNTKPKNYGKRAGKRPPGRGAR